MTVKIDDIVIGKDEIAEILPHRHPMLLIDCVTAINEEKIVAHLNLDGSEFFFQGHFPTDPIMPGGMIDEAIAQAAAVLVLRSRTELRGKTTLFTGKEVKYRRQVKPGETLRSEVELESLKFKRGTYFAKFKGRALVGDELAAEAIIKATIKM